MDGTDKKRSNKYDNVMSRVQNRSRNSLKSVSHVTRHEILSSESVGAKPSVSNVGSSVFSELPIVLNDYSPEVPTRRKIITKPRKTIRSLDPATSPHHNVSSIRNIRQPVSNIRARGSAPVVTNRKVENWSDTHYRQCHSSRSHDRLNDIKDEIKAYRETDKQMKLRSRLYRSCGVILDDVGQVAADKGVQVTPPEAVKTDKEDDILRRVEWLKVIGRPDLLKKPDIKYSSYLVCSMHFEDAMMSVVRLQKLLPGAVPTKLLSTTDSQPSTSKPEDEKHSPDDVSVKSETLENERPKEYKGTQTPEALSSDTSAKRKLAIKLRESEMKRRKLQNELDKIKKEMKAKNSLPLDPLGDCDDDDDDDNDSSS